MIHSLKLRSLFAALMCALLLAVPAAFAHSHPVSMAPLADATVDPAPPNVTMHFSGDLEPKFSSITVSESGGHVVNKVASVVSTSDAKTMSVDLPKLVPGVYTVSWVAVSVDTHRMTGEYKFTVAGVPPPPAEHAH